MSDEGSAANSGLNRAQVYLDAGRMQDAHRAAGRILAQDPDNVAALIVLAVSAGDIGRHAEAVEAAKRAVTIDPDSDYAWRVLALALGAVGAMSGAVKAADRAIQLAPTEWLTHLVASIVLAMFEDHDLLEQAVQEAEIALHLAPHEPAAHVTHGNALLAQGRRREAKNAYEQALRLDPADQDALTNLGVVRTRRLRLFAAADTFARVLRQSPGNELTTQNFVRTVGLVGTFAGLLGFAALLVSLRVADSVGRANEESGPITAPLLIVVAAVVGQAVVALRLALSGRAHLRTLWRDHRMTAAAWFFSMVSLLVASLLYLYEAPTAAVDVTLYVLLFVGCILSGVGLSKMEEPASPPSYDASPDDLD